MWKPGTKLELFARTSVFNRLGMSLSGSCAQPQHWDYRCHKLQYTSFVWVLRIRTWATSPKEARPLETNFLHGKNACAGRKAQHHGLSGNFQDPVSLVWGSQARGSWKSTTYIPCHDAVGNRLACAVGLPSRRGEEWRAEDDVPVRQSAVPFENRRETAPCSISM